MSPNFYSNEYLICKPDTYAVGSNQEHAGMGHFSYFSEKSGLYCRKCEHQFTTGAKRRENVYVYAEMSFFQLLCSHLFLLNMQSVAYHWKGLDQKTMSV